MVAVTVATSLREPCCLCCPRSCFGEARDYNAGAHFRLTLSEHPVRKATRDQVRPFAPWFKNEAPPERGGGRAPLDPLLIGCLDVRNKRNYFGSGWVFFCALGLSWRLPFCFAGQTQTYGAALQGTTSPSENYLFTLLSQNTVHVALLHMLVYSAIWLEIGTIVT